MFLWTAFWDLPWWGSAVVAGYTLYFILRACRIWSETSYHGIRKGYKNVFFGRDAKEIRLYHLIRIVFDIPPAIIGLLFPFIKSIAVMKIHTFKEPKKPEKPKTKEEKEKEDQKLLEN